MWYCVVKGYVYYSCQSAGMDIKYLPNNKILDVTKLKAFADDK